jgi:hypothetical protein
MLTPQHKMQRMGLALQHLNCYHNMLARIVTGDESWVHHYQPETKRVNAVETSSGTAWFRQQPKEFHAVSFQGLVKRWDKCLSVQGDYVEK